MVVDGLPAGIAVSEEAIARELFRRQQGYGRGGRMAIERDRAELRGGVRHGLTLGGPVALWIENRDHPSWRQAMAPGRPSGTLLPEDRRELSRPRPGHADLAGSLKHGSSDARGVSERASARETAARVAAGALARGLLGPCGIEVRSHVIAVGEIGVGRTADAPWEAVAAIPDDDPFRAVAGASPERLRAAVDAAREAGDTLGGVFEVVAHTPPPGLGSFAHWDLRLDGRIGQALLSIPAVKWVAIGHGLQTVAAPGSLAHDPILPGEGGGYARPSNRAGGIEGGMTNGEEVRVRAGVKPLATLMASLPSVDLTTGQAAPAGVERSDVTVVPAAAVVGEAMLALVLAGAVLEKFGGDSLEETLRNLEAYRAGLPGRAAGRTLSGR